MKDDTRLLVFLIDALGHRLARETGAFDFLPHDDGPVKSVCGYSSACLPSLLTGRLPVEHGHWGMYLRDPRRSLFRKTRPVTRIVSGLLGHDYLARRIVSRALRASGVDGYFSLYDIPLGLLSQFDLCQKRDIYAPGGLAPHETPFDVAEQLALPWRGWAWQISESERRKLFAEALDAGEARFLFFYSPLLDSVCHEHGTRSREARACLADLAGFVDEMRARAKRNAEARVLVCGDHGMADVRTSVDLMTPLFELPLRMPRDFLAFLDATMIRVWYFRDGARERVEGLLARSSAGRILSDEECAREGILFDDRRYGETIYLAHPGTMFVPSFMGRAALRAMHGYHPDDVDSDTIVRADFAHPQAASILDIGPMISNELRALAGATAGATAGAMTGAAAVETAGATTGTKAGAIHARDAERAPS